MEKIAHNIYTDDDDEGVGIALSAIVEGIKNGSAPLVTRENSTIAPEMNSDSNPATTKKPSSGLGQSE